MPKMRKRSKPKTEHLLRPCAQDDLKKIATYTKERWGIAQRDKYVGQLATAFEKLARNPKIAQKHKELGEGYKTFGVGKHIVIFQECESDIQVVRILHGGMNLRRQFNRNRDQKLDIDKRHRKKRSRDKDLEPSR